VTHGVAAAALTAELLSIPNVLFRPQHALTQRGRVGQAHELEPRSARTVPSGRRAFMRVVAVTQGECAGWLKAGRRELYFCNYAACAASAIVSATHSFRLLSSAAAAMTAAA
jgi:hypothetical protein